MLHERDDLKIRAERSLPCTAQTTDSAGTQVLGGR